MAQSTAQRLKRFIVVKHNFPSSILQKILKAEGFSAFFAGALVNAIRGVGAALILAMYNETSKYV